MLLKLVSLTLLLWKAKKKMFIQNLMSCYSDRRKNIEDDRAGGIWGGKRRVDKSKLINLFIKKQNKTKQKTKQKQKQNKKQKKSK